MLVQPVIADPTQAGIERAYHDWRQEMPQAHDGGLRLGGIDISRAAFDAAAVYRPRTVADVELERVGRLGPHIAIKDGRGLIKVALLRGEADRRVADIRRQAAGV